MGGLLTDLTSIRDRYHVKNHPFFDEWAAGRLTMRQMGAYMVQHYLHIEDIFQTMAVMYARAPMDARIYIVENLSEEHGLRGMADRDAENHFEIIKRFVYAAGYSETVFAPENRYDWCWARIHSFWDVVTRYPWQVFLAMLFTLESQEVGLNGRLVPAFYQTYGFKKGDPVIRFFEEHYLADQEHGSRTLTLLEKHVADPELRAQCLTIAGLGCRYKWNYVEEIYQRVVVKGELPPG